MPDLFLVVAVRPADEVLGAVGTIARHTDATDVVHVLIVAEGRYIQARAARSRRCG